MRLPSAWRAAGALAAALAFVLPLAACSGSADTVPVARACPAVTVLADAAAVTRYRSGRGRDLTDVVTDARVTGARGECNFSRAEVTMNLGVSFAFAIGPANRDRTIALSYFVAIVDAAGNMVAREEMPILLQVPVNQSSAAYSEEVEPRIPFRDRGDLVGYRVYVGLVLTPEEAQARRRR